LPFCLNHMRKWCCCFSSCVLLCPQLSCISHFLQWIRHLLSGIIYHHSACWVFSFQDETRMFWLVQVLSGFLNTQPFENAI
jgi:hypothetical protein